MAVREADNMFNNTKSNPNNTKIRQSSSQTANIWLESYIQLLGTVQV